MDRWACVDVPALPLQILLRQHPAWAAHPAAVVAHDAPQALILWINEQAREAAILPGMRYATALSLCSDLRAGVVGDDEIAQAVSSLIARLRRFSPRIEPAPDQPGVFWLDATGLERLFPTPEGWAQAIRALLEEARLRSSVAVGTTRFGTYAAARAGPGVRVFRAPSQERAATRAIPLARLHLDPGARDFLSRLGVHTVGELLALPAEGLRRRLGPEALALHRMATGRKPAPLVPAPPPEPLRRRVELDFPVTCTPPLLAHLARGLAPLLEILARRQQAAAGMHLRLLLDDGRRTSFRVRPATPTLQLPVLRDLLGLHLEREPVARGVVEVWMEVEGTPALPDQLRLYARSRPRDLSAANRALARVRAQFGDSAVACAELEDGHRPEASFRWRPLGSLAPPRPREVTSRPLVRRLEPRPSPLRRPSRLLSGPFVVSGEWWLQAVDRDYYFAPGGRGALLWVYYDHRARRWFCHGQVE